MRQRLPGFNHFAAWTGGETQDLLEDRLLHWLRLASDDQLHFSRDGLRLAAKLCAEEGHHWTKLAHRSLLISSGAGMRFVTSWSVLGASTLPVSLDNAEQLPAALRKAPTEWPNAELSARLNSLREDEFARSSLQASASLSALPPNTAHGHGSHLSERIRTHVLDHQQ